MGHKKELSIITVNYMNYDLTTHCVESVLKTTKGLDYEIIVIDNNSPNDSFEKIKDKFITEENVTVIKNESNTGFGAANNLAVSQSNGEYILFLNPDVVILDDAINKMLEKLKSNSNIGLVSGKLLNDDYTVQYSCRRILTLKEFLLARTPVSKFLSDKRRREITSYYLMKDFDHNEELEVEWVMGACMLIAKKYFEELSGFSKEYFMYFEDVDLCYKVRKNGKKVIYLPEAKMIHLHRQESTKKITKMTFVHLKSMMKFYYKYYVKKF